MNALLSDVETQFRVPYDKKQVSLRRIREFKRELERERCARGLAEEELDWE